VRFDAPGVLPLVSNRENNLESTLQSSTAFDGESESKQSNKLSGEITVSVAEVLPNGYLVVQGEKLYTINQGHEHIRFSGIVRPEDVSFRNTVPSTRVADARIIYGGEGAPAETNVIGWLARFFISAIFPF
jgi:flagellar L-ring protein precursor FlgH